jgi:DNA-binding NtrC family response regulator
MEMDFEEPEDALRRLAESAFDLLIVYAGTGPDTASRLFEKAESAEPRPLRFVLTERPSIEEAVEFANAGAEGYLFAPFDPGRSGPAMEKPDRPRRLPGNGPPGGGSELVEISAAMKEVAERLRLVAPTDATVLLLGESGTGKEVAAKFLHANHPHRRNGPFVAVHCGAVPDTLLESELFGHVRGAFTGADRDRIGRFEQANGGTLFLDEISTMKPEAQVRLLRVLQERQVCRLGSSEARPVDVRVVVASNQDLKRLVEEGSFREDLFFRVSVFPVRLPLLRERLADLPELVRIFAERAQRKAGLGRPKRFSAEALLALSRWSWPGNVRELENAVEYATILSGPREIVLRQDLPPEISGGAGEELPAARASLLVTEEGINLRQAVSNLERELILQSLRLAAGNKARAAELLHLKRTTFLEKLKRLEEEGLLGPLQADLSRPALPASPAP